VLLLCAAGYGRVVAVLDVTPGQESSTHLADGVRRLCALGHVVREAGPVHAALSDELRRLRAAEAETAEASAVLTDVAMTVLALLDARAAARIDPLTGLLNRGAMLERLDEEIERARRTSTTLACLLIDLDDFKQVNDQHGHATGDALLRHVSGVLRGEFRLTDQVARYGGDEFVVILPQAAGPRAEIAARRALKALRGVHLLVEGRYDPVRASIGLAAWAEGESASDVLAKADVALLASKRQGKDRVALADA
jgi:diguanylate cyclase (GGDEF)-like protein